MCYVVYYYLLILFRATILQHESSQFGKVNTESVAKPALMRAGSEGELFLITFFIK